MFLQLDFQFIPFPRPLQPTSQYLRGMSLGWIPPRSDVSTSASDNKYNEDQNDNCDNDRPHCYLERNRLRLHAENASSKRYGIKKL